MVVDDDSSIRLTSKCLLESLGYHVLLAEDGSEAVDIYREKHASIDMVILDLKMPRMNGDEAFTHLMEIDSECKAIIVFGNYQKEQVSQLYEKGLKGFIEKPLHVVTLSKLVSEIVLNTI